MKYQEKLHFYEFFDKKSKVSCQSKTNLKKTHYI